MLSKGILPIFNDKIAIVKLNVYEVVIFNEVPD